MTMTFYHSVNHVRVVYTHKRHAKYDNRKCPDYVRAFVKENLGMAPRQLFETLLENHPSMNVTQAQVRYWSHYYKKNMDQDDNQNDDDAKSSSSRGSSAGATDTSSLLAQSIANNNEGKVNGGSDPHHTASLEGSPSQELQQQTEEEREQHERVQQLLLASNSTALQSLSTQSHQVGTTLLSGSIAISVPMSEPLTSSIVQGVLDESGKGLLHLPENLHPTTDVSSSSADSGRDAVVQQVTAFMKENDHHQQLLEQQQQQQEQPQPQSQSGSLKQEESRIELMELD